MYLWRFGMVVPWVKPVRRASLWWLRPAGDTLAAEKQVPRDEAARNDKVLFWRWEMRLGNKKRGLEGPRFAFFHSKFSISHRNG